MEIQAKIALEGNAAVQIDLLQPVDSEHVISISCDGRTLTVAGTEAPITMDDGALDLHIFLDKTVLEVFAQDGQIAVTRVIEPLGTDGSVALSATGGNARIDSLDLWALGPIW